MNTIKKFGSIFLFLVALVIANCSPQNTETNLQNVSLTLSKNMWNTLPIIAASNGYFSDENLNVELSYVQTGRQALDALVAGSTDLAAIVDINIAYLGFTDERDINVHSISVKSFDSAIVARKDAGIETTDDLANKSIGILPGTTSEYFLSRFLEKLQISTDEVNLIELQPIAIQTSIIEKGIDAGSIWQPFTHNVENILQDEITTFYDPEIYTGFMTIATTDSWGLDNSESLAAFDRAIFAAIKFIQEDEDSAKRIIASEIDLDLEIVSAMWNMYDFDYIKDFSELRSLIRNESNWIFENELIQAESVPSYERFFTF